MDTQEHILASLVSILISAAFVMLIKMLSMLREITNMLEHLKQTMPS